MEEAGPWGIFSRLRRRAGLSAVVQMGLHVFLKEASTDYHLLMAACTMTILPVLVLFSFTQRKFVEGVSGGVMR